MGPECIDCVVERNSCGVNPLLRERTGEGDVVWAKRHDLRFQHDVVGVLVVGKENVGIRDDFRQCQYASDVMVTFPRT